MAPATKLALSVALPWALLSSPAASLTLRGVAEPCNSTSSSSSSAPQEEDPKKQCLKVARKFIQRPKTSKDITNLAVDYCSAFTTPEEKQYVCPEFKDAVKRVLEGMTSEWLIDAPTFCTMAEARIADAERAVKVPNVGKGGLTDFEVARTCIPLARKHLGDTSVSRDKAGDVWYKMCMHQDCAHHLPSQTKSCDTDRYPTHSSWVCESARSFMMDTAKDRNEEKLNAAEICGLYSDFIKELSIDIDAFTFMIHGGKGKFVPVPGQEEQALVAAKLANEAEARELKRESGSPVGVTAEEKK